MEKKTILVTGSAGFIGSQLVRRLQNKGYRVLGIDNFNSHLYNFQLKHERHREFNHHIYDRDIRSGLLVEHICRHEKPDVVIHLAAHAGVRDSFGNEGEYHSNNIDGTQNLIDIFKKYSPDTKFIYASTSSVYGGTPIVQDGWIEEDIRGHQLNAYAYTKFVNECQFKTSGLQNVGLRFFTVYGPWGRPDMALFQFTKKILDGRPISLYNYGNMKRDFTYIEDILDGIEIVLEKFVAGEIESNEIFNIGRGEQVDLLDFVSAIEDCCGKKAITELVEKHPADTVETWSSTKKLEAYGYKPKTSIKEGVREFYEWYVDYTSKYGEL